MNLVSFPSRFRNLPRKGIRKTRRKLRAFLNQCEQALYGAPTEREVKIGEERLLGREYAGYTVLYSEGTSLVQRLKHRKSLYEPYVLRAMWQEAKKRNAKKILDIGANIGLHSLALLRRSSQLTIEAFEPSPHAANLLARTIAFNRLDSRLHLHRLALCDSEGWIDFCLHSHEHASGDGLRDTGRAGPTRKARVPATTLDHWWIEHSKPDVPVVKMDTEGAEFLILKGSPTFLSSCKPTLFLEISSKNLRVYDWGPMEIVNWLASTGYTLHELNGRPVKALDNKDDIWKQTDCFVARPEGGPA